VISFIGTLAYAIRLVGVRTGRVAVSFALFNVLMLVSRTASTFQVPLLTKFVEKNSGAAELLSVFNLIIILSGIGSVIGALAIPTFQRIFCKAVTSFSTDRSIAKLIYHSFSKAGILYIKESVAIPSKLYITKLMFIKLPKKILIYNILTVSMITVGAVSPVFAGSIEPSLRATCITLSAVINGIATILMSIFIDPQLSIMTDDVIEGKVTHEDFQSCVVGMVFTKVLGTFLSLLFLVPSAQLIVKIARFI
jgi:hypothetical protein